MDKLQEKVMEEQAENGKEVVVQQTEEPKKEEEPKESSLPENILERVNKLKSKKVVEEDVKFNVNELDEIQDPKAKEFVEKAYKSFERGFQRKYQEIADLRKQLETQLSPEKKSWTRERIQELLQDKSFVEAASSLIGPTGQPDPGLGTGTSGGDYLTEEEYSALSPQEKAEFNKMREEVSQLRKLNEQAQQQRHFEMIQQHDRMLAEKYADYDSAKVDNTLKELMSKQPHELREYVFKAVNYGDAIERAYQLGREEERQGIASKKQFSSPDMTSTNITPSETVPEIEKGESKLAYFKRLASRNLDKKGVRE